MTKRLARNLTEIKRDWPILSAYQRFESSVALVLTLIISAVILVALWRLIFGVVDRLVLQSHNPLEHAVFQAVFGDILTLLIALEFNHTLQYVVKRERGIIQAETVVLIAILALVRKFMVADLSKMSATVLAGEAALILALGLTYWLMREREERPLLPTDSTQETA
jgi:uncharacterized membrane protein (DUF373 family)